MTHKRKGQLTVSKEWAKHLRAFWKKQFWKGERQAEKKSINAEKISPKSDNENHLTNMKIIQILFPALCLFHSWYAALYHRVFV